MGDIPFNVDKERVDHGLPDWILEASNVYAADMCEKIDEYMLEYIREGGCDGGSRGPDQASDA